MANKIVDKIKESLNTTPVAFRWLLLIAAFVVVLILLFLLLDKPKNNRNVVPEDRDIKLIISPESANFKDTKIGTKAKQTFKIHATYDVVIDSVKIAKPIAGFNIAKSCVNENVKTYQVNKSIPCLVDVAFTPADTDVSGDATVVITWHDKRDARDTNKKTNEIVIPVSAVAAVKPAPVPEPKVEEKPAPTPVVDDTPQEEEPGEEDDDMEEMPDLTEEEDVFQPAPKPAPKPKDEAPKAVARPKAPEKCSDFAMPGYSTSGAQIGWIKPKDGRYEFHPFADKDCKNPTGIYNPDTGIITSIDGKGKKIGTDSDHIGFTGDITSAPKLKSKNVAARASSSETDKIGGMIDFKGKFQESGAGMELIVNKIKPETLKGSGTGEAVFTSRPYDRSFILRQFKPIPATIVSEVRADPSVYCPNGDCSKGSGIPVRATVDRNVYSDNGRNIIIPTGTLLMGYLTGDLPGPYKSVGRMKINWYQFIRPDGVEFNFNSPDTDPYSADAQGRVGVPGYGSTDYIEQMVMPLITAMIPAAVNMIAPIADTFVNQIDLDNNTVVQSGTVRSSELAKNEVITAWNKVAQKLIVDALDNTTPPFSIAAGTRITVYSPVDLIATCGGEDEENAGKKCAFEPYSTAERRPWAILKGQLNIDMNDASWVGQVRSFDLSGFCEPDAKTGVMTVRQGAAAEIAAAGHDYRTVLAYCQAQNYQGKTQAKYEAYYDNKLQQGIQGVDADGNKIKLETGTKEYNQQILGLEYDEDGNIKNPFEKPAAIPGDEPVGSLDCDGQAPDQYGCCPGETYTDMGDQGFNCCPDGGGDCFPPLDLD